MEKGRISIKDIQNVYHSRPFCDTINETHLFRTKYDEKVYNGDVVNFYNHSKKTVSCGVVREKSGLIIEVFNQLLNRHEYYKIELGLSTLKESEMIY